jgi:hypothetical protein
MIPGANLLTVVFAAVIGVSAFLVFWIQPLVARIMLPALGGSPSVWNTSVMFFQGMLLAGYLYSHLMNRWAPTRLQCLIHPALFLSAAVILPLQIDLDAITSGEPIALYMVLELCVAVGLPYMALCTTSPLLQRWYAASSWTGNRDPYFLYAASNAGSLGALLLFPIVLEQVFPLSIQGQLWTKFYLATAGGLVLCAVVLVRSIAREPVISDSVLTSDDRHAGQGPAGWLIRAFVPSSLMLGVTTHITTDVAAVSFLWIVPLALYLLTLILSFTGYSAMLVRQCTRALPYVTIAFAAASLRSDTYGALLLVPLELGVVFLVSMILHGQLYQGRPQADRLTTYYLWVALGGFAGGLFNTLLAPVLFLGVQEFFIVLAFALLYLLNTGNGNVLRIWKSAAWYRPAPREYLLMLAVMLLSLASAFVYAGIESRYLALVLGAAVSIGTALAFGFGARSGVLLWASLAALLVAVEPLKFYSTGNLYAQRNFFGSLRVTKDEINGEPYRIFTHGTTVHGIQAIDPEKALSGQSYYTILMGLLTPYLEVDEPANVAVTGLGAGNLACLGGSDDRITFYEIDPDVLQVAREYFSYLSDCPASKEIILGDARRSLQNGPPIKYDLMIMDAFSGDSVPVHLVTREAMELYAGFLNEDGMLAFHISNRYLDLSPAIVSIAAAQGWPAYLLSTSGSVSKEALALPSTWIVTAPPHVAAARFDPLPDATLLQVDPDFPVWRDDHVSLFRLLKWPWK